MKMLTYTTLISDKVVNVGYVAPAETFEDYHNEAVLIIESIQIISKQ